MPETLQQMIINLSQSSDAVMQMVTGGAYLIGMGFLFKALYHLKVYGELRTMMAVQTSMKTPIAYMVVGMVFMYFPTGLGILMTSTFGSPEITPLSYAPGTESVTSGEAIIAILRIVQVFGVIAFIRGWILITKASQLQTQQGYGKGVTHIIGGMAAINIVKVRDVLWTTFGFST